MSICATIQRVRYRRASASRCRTHRARLSTPTVRRKVPYTLDNLLNSKALSQYLWNKMFEIIREKESAVYTPMPRVSLENDLTGSYITIGCELATNPEKTVIAEKLAKEIIFDAQTR